MRSSSWVRVETKFIHHPKVLRVGVLGEALWLRGLCYAGEHLTDGFVPIEFVRNQVGMKGLPVAARLVEAELWEEVDGGYQIHDYLGEGLGRHGGITQDDRRPPLSVWRAIRTRILERDDYTCGYCGAWGVRLECDHVVPVSRGGSSDDDNLVAACVPCNRSKSAKKLGEWRP